MLEARHSLGTINSFIHDTQAYMKGQLLSSPVQEDVLWKRLVLPLQCSQLKEQHQRQPHRGKKCLGKACCLKLVLI